MYKTFYELVAVCVPPTQIHPRIPTWVSSALCSPRPQCPFLPWLIGFQVVVYISLHSQSCGRAGFMCTHSSLDSFCYHPLWPCHIVPHSTYIIWHGVCARLFLLCVSSLFPFPCVISTNARILGIHSQLYPQLRICPHKFGKEFKVKSKSHVYNTVP